MFFRILKLKPLIHNLYVMYEWRAEIQPYLCYMSLQK